MNFHGMLCSICGSYLRLDRYLHKVVIQFLSVVNLLRFFFLSLGTNFRFIQSLPFLWNIYYSGSINACLHSAVCALNHAQYMVNWKCEVASIPVCGKTGQLHLQYDIQFPSGDDLQSENVSVS